MKQVENYFKDYPASKECFTTSDGTVFHNKYDANMHAVSLKDDEVEEHRAIKYKTEKPEKEGKVSKGAKGGKEPKEDKEQKEEKEPEEPVK